MSVNLQFLETAPEVSRKRGVKRLFSSDCRGVVAIEFALIAPVFLYLLFGIIEVSLVLYASTVVDGATQAAARKIRTGEAQLSGSTQATFQTELCDEMGSIFDCNDVTLDVKTFSSFSSATIPDLTINGNGDLVYVDGDDDDSNDVVYVTEFTAGGAGDINVVRVIYSWDFFTPYIGNLLGDNDNSKYMSTTAVFRNEPYD